MAESTKQFDDRVRKEHRIQDFYRVKEWYMKAYPKDSGAQAYWACVEIFQPIHVPKKKDDDIEITGSCSVPEAIRWASDSLSRSDVLKSDAPSLSAWTLYEWANANAVNKSEFMKQLFGKLIPSNKQLEDAARMQDDGRSIEELIERIENA